MTTDKETILVVDDEIINIEVIGEILDSEYEIIFATKGTDAIQVARNAQPDLILLDVMMPGMDGYEVCSQLKTDAATATIPIIFITGLNAVEQEVRGLEAGATDYVTKPISPPIIRARVRNQLEFKRAREMLEMMATTDSLTGLANRRRFDDALQLEFQRLKRSQELLTVILIDVDNFKEFNDTYGHPAGDDCLRRVADVVRQAARRPADLAARYGGEEFVCLLPEVTHIGAINVAEGIRQAVFDLTIPYRSLNETVHLTVSLGIATASCITVPAADHLIMLADKQLYEAKAAGRNCTKGQEVR